MKQTWIRYIQDTYSVEAEYPWQSSPDFAVFRHQSNRKWFAVLMAGLPPKSLGLASRGTIDVLNLKCDPMLSGSVKDGIHIFPAYHMNKEHWISVLLDESLELETLKVLIDMSWELTREKKDLRRRKCSTKNTEKKTKM